MRYLRGEPADLWVPFRSHFSASKWNSLEGDRNVKVDVPS